MFKLHPSLQFMKGLIKFQMVIPTSSYHKLNITSQPIVKINIQGLNWVSNIDDAQVPWMDDIIF